MHPAQYEAYKSGKAKEDFLEDVVKRRAEKDKSPEEDAKPKTPVSYTHLDVYKRQVVNCAAYTAVDKAEDNSELAYQLNCEAPKQLALSLIHI